VVTTIDTEQGATELARQLVEDRLAACVQVSGPITSIYRWNDAVKSDREWRLLAKTTAKGADRLMGAIAKLHPYKVPQIVAWPVPQVHTPYADWVTDSVEAEGAA